MYIHRKLGRTTMALLIGCLSCMYTHTYANDSDGELVSIIKLIAVPDRYQNKVVTVRGYFKFELENMSLCFQERALSTECLWVEIDTGPYEADNDLKRYQDREKLFKKFNRKVVFITGKFNAKNTGHLGMWSGAIEDIRDIR